MFNLKNITHILSRPKVFGAIIFGMGVMTLTFFTDNNALEIAISGIASIFIGIGVNNFSIYQTHAADEKTVYEKIDRSLIIMEIVKKKINKLNNFPEIKIDTILKSEISEINQLITLGIKLMKDAEILK